LEFVNILLQMVAKPVKMRLYFFNSAVIAKIKTGLLWTNMLCAKKQCIATVEKGLHFILSIHRKKLILRMELKLPSVFRPFSE